MPRPAKPLSPGNSGLALFGSTLRMYREAAGETLAGLAQKINFSASTIGETERGESRCDRALAVSADRELTTGGALAHLWDYLVKASVYPRWFDWPTYEARAAKLLTFQATLVYGLLQTEDYARELLEGDEPAIAARMGRQDILTREDFPPPFLVCILDQSVLYREVGNREIMAGQLDQLVAAVSKRLRVHIVPSVAHDGISGSFVIATLEDRSEVAYIETAARGISTSTKEDLTTLSESFDSIRSRALPVDQSIDLIRKIREEQWT